MLPDVVHHILSHVFGLSSSPGKVCLFKHFIVVKGFELKIRIFDIQIFIQQIFSFIIYALVYGSEIQHIVKHIIAGDYPAAFRYSSVQSVIAHLCVIIKEIAAIVQRISLQLKRFGYNVKGSTLARTVSSAQNGNLVRFKSVKVMFR